MLTELENDNSEFGVKNAVLSFKEIMSSVEEATNNSSSEGADNSGNMTDTYDPADYDSDTEYAVKKKVYRKKKSYYNEYNSIVMQWAESASTKPGDTRIFNENGKRFVLVKKTEDGYVEVIKGNYGEVYEEYERLYSQEDRSFYEDTQEIRSSKRGDFRNLQSDEGGRNDSQDSGYIGEQKFRDESTGNNEHLQQSDSGISKLNSPKTEADSEEPAFSVPENDGREYALRKDVAREVNKALYDKNYKGEIKLTDSSPTILLSQKGVRNLPMIMKVSHIRENIFSEQEARKMALRLVKT